MSPAHQVHACAQDIALNIVARGFAVAQRALLLNAIGSVPAKERGDIARIPASGLWQCRRIPSCALTFVGGSALTTAGVVIGLIQFLATGSSRKDLF